MPTLYVEDGYVIDGYIQTGITIDWLNRIIFIPKYVMPLVQITPTEIRELNLNEFRLALKDLEDTPEGMVFPDTHIHHTEVDVGGLTLARVIEIINGYTVTFEDDKYAVNLVGANSNVGDVVNVNQVSVRSQNSAGLISSPDIEYSSFNGGVTYDPDSPYAGTVYPIGTPRKPVNNIPDAGLIALYRGFNIGYVINYLNMDDTVNISDFTFIGGGGDKTPIHIQDEAIAENCTYKDAHVTGVLDGHSKLLRCLVTNLNYVNGYMDECLLSTGRITLGGGQTAFLLNCGCGSSFPSPPVIDMGGSGQSLMVRNYSGNLRIENKTGASDIISIDMNSGRVVIDLNSVTAGLIRFYGVGELIDQDDNTIVTGTYGNLVVVNKSLNNSSVCNAVWDHVKATALLDDVDFIKDIEGGRWRIHDKQMIFYASDNITEVARFNLFDKTGTPSGDNVYERVRT